MRRLLLSFFASLTLAVPAFAATGVNLAWDACLGSGGVSNKTFACDTNTGTDYLYVSFVSDTAIAEVNGMQITLDGTSCSSIVPLWWQFKISGACRMTALSERISQGSESPGCVNPWGPSAGGGISYYNFVWPRPTFRIHLIYAVPLSEQIVIAPGQETFAVRLAISHAKTVGVGACGDCETPVALGIHWFGLMRPWPTRTLVLNDETIPGSSTVGWQGSAPHSYVPPPPQGTMDPWPHRTVECALPVPARNHTWGTIKSLYR